MEWVPLTDYENGIDLADRPRRLTQEEIVYIVEHVPLAPSADSTAAEVARQGVIEWMIETLREISIAPSAIPALIQQIIHQHNKSLVTPGTPIGITAAEAVGATTTQMTLNSVAPWERILIQDRNGDGHLVKIGQWIDDLIENNTSKVKHIPENRTQYLELEHPVTIATPDKNGRVTWDKITAVTKHLPVGDLVRVTTNTGREITATQSKSLLIWDEPELVQREGSSVKVGDLVPILSRIPEPSLLVENKFGYKLDYSMGVSLGIFFSGGTQTHELDNWIVRDGSLPIDILFTPSDFLSGFMCGMREIPSGYDDYFNYINSRIGATPKSFGDVFLDPIISVEFVPATEYVYDVTVPTTTNFSLWNGMGTADTFHTSGSAKSASFGIEAMRDLIFARKNPKNESTTIYYTDKTATYEKILDSRRYIVGSVVSDFVKDHDIESPHLLQRFWWHDTVPILLRKEVPDSTKVLRLFLNTEEMFKHRVTIADLAAVLEREVPPSAVAIHGPIGDGIIDLYPHPGTISETLKGREKGVIPPDLAEVTYLESVVMPELSNIRVKGISGIKHLYPLVSPVWRMVLLERKLSNADLITPELAKFLAPYLGRAWLLFYNNDVMRMTGLIAENLAALCEFAGLQVIAGTQDRLIVGMPHDRFRTDRGDIVYEFDDRKFLKLTPNSLIEFEGVTYKEVNETYFTETDDGWDEKIDDNSVLQWPFNYIIKIEDKLYKQVNVGLIRQIGDETYEEIVAEQGKMVKITEVNPSDYISKKVMDDKIANKKEIERLTQINIEAAQGLPESEKRALIRKPVTVPRTNLMKASEFVIAETTGSNLKELLALPGIDKTRTTCNNMYTITATLGIEAARTFLIRALSNTISNTGSYVHPANIMFIAEFITSRGEPYGATYTGISRQPGGHISLSTVEKAGKVLTQNALHGRKEDIRNVSASVAVGTRMAIGTGSFDIAQDITDNGARRTVINDDLFTALDNDDTTKQAVLQNQYTTINADELLQGVEDLKGLTVGDVTFDYTGGEKEADLIKLFGAGEMIPQTLGPRPEQPGAQHKVVRRVQTQEAVVPRDLIDTLAQIKVGVPIPETATKVTISPLETGVLADQPRPIPIASTGLIPFSDIFPENLGTGIPTGLEALLNQYLADEPVGQETIVEPLPTVEIPDLPDLEGFNLARDAIQLRREQVRDLKPVDIDALSKI